MVLNFLALGTIMLTSAPAAALPESIPSPPTSAPISAKRERPKPCAQGCLNPIEAVTFASYLGDRAGVAGEFALPIKAVGFEKERVFLNSETDYRDRNCLTVVLPMATAKAIAGSADPAAVRKHFEGRRVIVRGIAKQVRIDFTDNGQPTGKYYYQVHLPVGSPNQIVRLPG